MIKQQAMQLFENEIIPLIEKDFSDNEKLMNTAKIEAWNELLKVLQTDKNITHEQLKDWSK